MRTWAPHMAHWVHRCRGKRTPRPYHRARSGAKSKTGLPALEKLGSAKYKMDIQAVGRLQANKRYYPRLQSRGSLTAKEPTNKDMAGLLMGHCGLRRHLHQTIKTNWQQKKRHTTS